MSELPSGWTEAPLPFVCTKITDGTHHSPVNLPTGEYKYVTAKNIRPWGLDLSDISFVDAQTHQEIYARCPVEKGDVLYIKDGATTGIAAVNPLDEPFSMLSSVALLKPDRRALEPSYLKHWLNSPETLSMMLDKMTGTAIRRLTLTTISAQIIPVAPLPEQRRIVAKVDGLTARTARAREELDRIPILIARYKQRLLALAFSGGLTRGAEGWRTAAIGDLADTQLGKMLDKAKNKGEPTRYLRNINVRWYDFELDDVLEMPMSADERRKFSIVDGDILTCEGGEPGRSAIWNQGPTDLAFQKALIRIRPDLEQLNPAYLVHHLKFLADTQELERHFTGSTIKHLPQRALRGVEFPVPPIEEQAEIVRCIESAFGWLDRMAADHAAAARLLPKLDAAILAKAFRGDLVEQDPNDEPAKALMERIKEERDVAAAKSTRPRGRARVHRLQADDITNGPPEIGKPGLTVISASSKGGTMPKSRHDKDVSGKPYLATIVKQLGDELAPEALFARSNLELVDFYRQLDFECAEGWLEDNKQGPVKAA